MRLDKPIGILLLLWPTLQALWVAAHGMVPHYTIVVFSLGVLFTRTAGCIINDICDAKFDRYVQRTQYRPLAARKLSITHAILCFISLVIISGSMAIVYLHIATIALAIIAALIFATYPLMKRYCALPQIYLGIAFSLGILMAFVELTGTVSYTGWLLFIANLAWVFAYDTIYAMVDMEDDQLIGVKSAALTLGKYAVTAVAVSYSIYFVLLLAVGIVLKLHSSFYLAMLVVVSLLVYQVVVLLRGQKQRYFKLFLLNNWVGLFAFLGFVS